jgi:histidinol-phosphatase (PHP family)
LPRMIMNKTDYHIHTEFSADSRLKLSELLPHALKLGYSKLAITEHLDLSPQELSVYGVPSLIRYKNAIHYFRKQYPGTSLYCGIEVGDFQDVKEFADPILKQMGFDLVLGSVHFIRGRTNVAVPLKNPLSPVDTLEYYENNLKLVQTCDIDILAHLGVYKRYYSASPDESHCLTTIKQIFQTIIEKRIALEINFSAFRRTYQNLHPEPEYLELYKNMGGRLVTLGSDSHTLSHFDDKYDVAYGVLNDLGLELLSVTYQD